MQQTMRQYTHLFMLGLWLTIQIFMTSPCAASTNKQHAPSIEQQRIIFQKARQALRNHDTVAFERLYTQLSNYPLTPYLDIWKGFQRIKEEKDREVSAILDRYPDVPESLELRIAWMQALAERGQWPHVAKQLAQIPHATNAFPNIALRSTWYNGDKKAALNILTNQWRHGSELPSHITNLMQLWKSAGHPNQEDLWARIIFYIQRGQWKKVTPLKHRLNITEQAWITAWRDVQRHPEQALLDTARYHIEPDIMARMARDGLRRLASHDIDKAWATLARIQPLLGDADFTHLQQKIALRAGKQHLPQADTWLSSISEQNQTAETRAWYIRTLLLKKGWHKALSAIQAMPEHEQMKTQWIYWQGALLEKLGQTATAKTFFEQASLERGYYSFLSANRLEQPYQMGYLPAATPNPDTLAQQANIQRAYEWRQQGEPSKARREWQYALQHASLKTWQQALQLANQWQWHEQTIRAASKSKQFHALRARFPLAYDKDVERFAHRNHLKKSMIWSVIRQESAFNPHAVSRSKAQGLMQLMPKTATYIVKKHAVRHKESIKLDNPTDNIQLGSTYLADLLQRFHGNEALAIAAYNAGPNRVSSWLDQVPFDAADIWIELIPFHETRRYVQHVLSFMAVYNWLQNKPQSALFASSQAIKQLKDRDLATTEW